jgi:hypothetical protein
MLWDGVEMARQGYFGVLLLIIRQFRGYFEASDGDFRRGPGFQGVDADPPGNCTKYDWVPWTDFRGSENTTRGRSLTAFVYIRKLCIPAKEGARGAFYSVYISTRASRRPLYCAAGTALGAVCT